MIWIALTPSFFRCPRRADTEANSPGRSIVLVVVERADMQFVDDKLVPGREMEVVPLPVEARIVNDGVADRAGHLAGIRVDALEIAHLRGQEELVLIADMSLSHIGVPVAVLLGLQGMFGAIPSVERSDDGYSLAHGAPTRGKRLPLRAGSIPCP